MQGMPSLTILLFDTVGPRFHKQLNDIQRQSISSACEKQGKPSIIALFSDSIGPRFHQKLYHIERRILPACMKQGKLSMLVLLFAGIWALLHPLTNLVTVYCWFFELLTEFLCDSGWMGTLYSSGPLF
jgi:hypothetical protein